MGDFQGIFSLLAENFQESDPPIMGKLGFEVNGRYVYNVDNDKNMIYVRANYQGRETKIEAFNLGVPLVPDYPVIVYYANRHFYAHIDYARLPGFVQNTNLPSQPVGPHTHEPGYGLVDFVSSIRFRQGLAYVTTGNNLRIDPFFYIDNTGTLARFAGGVFDLTTYIETLAGHGRWTFVSLLRAAGTIDIQAGGTVLPVFPVDQTEIIAAGFSLTGRLPLLFVLLVNGQTEIAFQQIVDARLFIEANASSGGGGVGALSELSDVILTAPVNGDLLTFNGTDWANAPGGGSVLWMPFAQPLSPSTHDDEFNGASGGMPASGRWTESDFLSNLTVTEAEDGLTLSQGIHSGAETAGLYQTIPAGDFTIATYVSLAAIPPAGVTESYAGIIFWENPTDSSGDIAAFVIGYDQNKIYLRVFNQTAYNAGVNSIWNISTNYGLGQSGVFLRVRRNGSTYYFDVSFDGIRFVQVYYSGGMGIMPPTKFGIGLSNNDTGNVSHAAFQFFRYVASDVGIGARLAGQRINLGIRGITGTTGVDGPTGGAVSIKFVFDTATADADPTSGHLRLNNAIQNISTVIRINPHDVSGGDWTTAIDQFDDSTDAMKGYIRLFKTSDITKWILFSVSSMASPTGYRNVSVAVISASSVSPFANADPVTLTFDRTGSVGAPGTPGIPGEVQEVHVTAPVAVDNTDPMNPVVSVPEFVGDTGTGGIAGLVPAPAAGDTAADKFLKADKTWAVPSTTFSGDAFDVPYAPTTPGDWASSPANTGDAVDKIAHIAGSNIGNRVTLQHYADARPSSPYVGDLVKLDDGYWDEIWTGSNWLPIRNHRRLHDPSLHSWSWLNQGVATIDGSLGAQRLVDPMTGTGSFRQRLKAAPTPPYVITALFMFQLPVRSSVAASIQWWNSSAVQGISLLLDFDTGGLFYGYVYSWTTATTPGSSLATLHYGWRCGVPVWARLINNATNRIIQVSYNGDDWITVYSGGLSDSMGVEDQVGFGLWSNPAASGEKCTFVLISWDET